MSKRYPTRRARLEAAIERAIAILDSLDGDENLEADTALIVFDPILNRERREYDLEQDVGDMPEAIDSGGEVQPIWGGSEAA